jgi:pimeloyl-ACP methyl ester carboxylesterase
MPTANVRGIHLHYDVIGQGGPWIAFMPGGRKAGNEIQSLAEKIANAGYRVLLHDRRNCGASDVVIEGDQPEYEIWADDLYELLKQLDAFPAIVGGSSSGSRTALVLALKYPDVIRALLLMRVTGGYFGCTLLAEDYYGQFIKIAEQSGMAAICETDHFAACIAARPINRERLMSMDTAHFIAIMQNWKRYVINGIDQPVLGADKDKLQSLHVPTLIVPGNDKIHPREVGEKLHQLLPRSEISIVIDEQFDVDSVPSEDWVAQYDTLTERFTSFIARNA